MKLLNLLLFASGLVLSVECVSQRVEVQEFVFRSSECPDFITSHPELRERLSNLLVDGLRRELGVEEVVFRTPDKLTYRPAANNWLIPTAPKNELRPRKDPSLKYFASVVSLFQVASIVSDGEIEVLNLNFKTKVMVVDAKGKKVFRKTSKIPARVDPHCGKVSDSWLSKRDFEQLLTMGIVDAFGRNRTKRPRLLLSCGRSFQLHERLSRLDSFEVRKRRKLITAVSGDSTFYSLEVGLGGIDPEFTEWLFGLDLSSRLKQKGSVIDRTHARRYDLVVSMNAKENQLDSLAEVSSSDPAITYFVKDQLVTQFHLLQSGKMQGNWNGDLVTMDIDYDGFVNYYINGEWVALSQYFPPNRPNNEKYSTDLFYHERHLSKARRETLVHALLAFELGQAIRAVAEAD